MKLSIVTALALATAGGAVPRLRVGCQAAAGYYGAIDALEYESEVVISVSSGIKFRLEKFLGDLKVNLPAEASVSRVAITVPTSACQRLKNNPVVFTCLAQNVDAVYFTDAGKENRIRLSTVTVEFSQIVTTIVHGTLSQIKVMVVGVREVESDQFATGKMFQKFQTPDGPVHSSCRAL